MKLHVSLSLKVKDKLTSAKSHPLAESPWKLVRYHLRANQSMLGMLTLMLRSLDRLYLSCVCAAILKIICLVEERSASQTVVQPKMEMSDHRRLGRVSFFIRFEKNVSVSQQWMYCSEWLPSE